MVPERPPLDPQRLQRAKALVGLAWRDLPDAHRSLLENIGAAQWDVVDRPLRACVDDLLISSGNRLQTAFTVDLDQALGVWVPDLRVVVIDAGHPVLAALDDVSYETMLVRAAWHEWGHALSIARAHTTDIEAGERYLRRAPEGVREVIRAGGYRVREYTHELVAETYALLMIRRRRGVTGQPPWLDDEIYELMRRVCGWTE